MRPIVYVLAAVLLFSISLAGCSKCDIPKAPVADFTFSIANPGELPANVNFTSTSTGADSYTWEFGDGSPVNETAEQIISHIYSTAGEYAVRLVAIGDGGRDSVIKYVPITGK